MTALTRGRVARLASDRGWLRTSRGLVDIYVQDEASADADQVRVRFSKSGSLVHAGYFPGGQNWSAHPKHNKLAFVRGWLAGGGDVPEVGSPAAPDAQGYG